MKKNAESIFGPDTVRELTDGKSGTDSGIVIKIAAADGLIPNIKKVLL